MVKKARLFEDEETAKAVMAESDPVAQKRLGKNIQHFNKSVWENQAKDLIVPALQSKFEQCQVSRNTLLNTNNNDIFEANPRDLFWGVGIALHSNEIWDISKHKGANLLGKCLQIVRNNIVNHIDHS